MAGCRVACLDAAAMGPHIDAWRDLGGRCLEPNVFNDPAFALPAARFVRSRLRPRFLLVWDDAEPRLIGLCCITIPPFGMPVSAWLHEQATAAFPLLDAADAGRAFEAMMAFAAGSRRRPAGLMLHGVPADGETARLLAARGSWTIIEIERRSRAVLRSEDRLTDPPGKSGKECRRQARRLAEHGTVALTSARDPDPVSLDVEQFLQMEAAGWKGRRGTALLQSDALAAFARTMTRGLAEAGDCRVDRLAVQGRPIAMGIVLRSRDRAYYWKTTYDEAFARFSPGAHLTRALGRQQRQEPGLTLTDSCAIPDHSMIDRLWPSRMTVLDMMVGEPAARRAGLAFAARAERMRRCTRMAVKRLLAVSRQQVKRERRPP